MKKLMIAVTALLLTACGGGSSSSFDEDAVRDAVEASGIYTDDPAGADSAVDTFRNICESPDDSINEFSVHGLLTETHPPDFEATARLGCPDKFDKVQRMIDDGECFGGTLAGC